MDETRRDAPYRAGQTALLLVDLQRIWLEPGLDPHHPERDESHPFYSRAREIVVPNNERLLDAARGAGVEVLHTIIRSLTTDGRDRSLDHKLTPIHVRPEPAEALPPASLAPLADEILHPQDLIGRLQLHKYRLPPANLGIRQLIVTGIMTDQCVDMTVRDAADRGYLVTCVSDACAAATPERHEGALAAFGGYCWIADTTTVVERLARLRGGRAGP